jgi:outer membrane protein assembly factor BamB
MRRLGSILAFLLITSPLLADDWPQWLGPKRDGVWRESGILDKFPADGPRVLWRQPIGPGYTGPAVADGRVFLMDRVRKLDEEGKPLPPVKKQSPDGKPVPSDILGSERVLCLSATDGKTLWKHEYESIYSIGYPEGPRCTPTVAGQQVYSLGAMGDLRCLEAATGKVVWAVNLRDTFNAEVPVWGWAAHVLVDGDKVITLAGGEGSAVVALNRHTGKLIWKNLSVREIGYCPPVIVEAAGKRQLIVWHTDALNALDPDTGKLYWSVPFPTVPVQRPGITVAIPQHRGDRLFVSAPHHGSLMVRLKQDVPGAEVLWTGKSDNLAKPDGLHALMGTPAFKDGYVYGVCNFGELRCLNADTGERVWESYDATTKKKMFLGSAFLVEHGERFFICNDLGDLIIARLSGKGYEEISRCHLLDTTLSTRGREVVWSHPAFANRCVYARNDKEIICVSLARVGDHGGKQGLE